jgi:hypothetical protein
MRQDSRFLGNIHVNLLHQVDSNITTNANETKTVTFPMQPAAEQAAPAKDSWNTTLK